MGYKVLFELSDGTKVWINLQQIVKMIKTPDGKYYIYLINGDVFEVDKGAARTIENYFEGRYNN